MRALGVSINTSLWIFMWRDKSNIHALRWDVYTKYKEEFINREFLVSVPHPKGEGIVWTGMNDNTTDEKDQYKSIGLRGFDYKLFEEEESGGTIERLDSYHNFKHKIQLWPVIG